MARPASVIVVSRGRPESLSLCLAALARQDHPNFELIVVADPASLASARATGLPLCEIAFNRPNIAEARNLGIGAAAGDIIAFIDDDAFAEPTWLSHLTTPFEGGEIGLAGGFVRGRNGISYQWRARRIDRIGFHHPETVPEGPPVTFPADPKRPIKTEGTNMAATRALLADLGGFDGAYRFYLEDADLNLRAAEIGAPTAIVPFAQVVHVTAASERRAQTRMPRSLHEIGASLAYFLSRHAPETARAEAMAGARVAERARLLRHMVGGNCVPGDVARLLAGFDAGLKEGAARRPALGLTASPRAFEPLRQAPARHELSGREYRAKPLRAQAKAAAAAGDHIDLYLFSRTALYHHTRFRAPGYWEHSGGLFGRAMRKEPLFSPYFYSTRLQKERRRVAQRRGLPH